MMRILEAKIATLQAINVAIEWVANIAASLLVAAMLVTVVWTVIARLSGISAPWTEKVMLILLPTLAFVAAPVAYRRGANVALDMLVQALPARLKAIHGIVLHTAIVFLLLIGLDLTLRKVGIAPEPLTSAIRFVTTLDLSEIRPFRAPIKIPVINIEWRYFYMVMPVMIAATILAGLELWLRDLHALLAPSTREAEAIRTFDDVHAHVEE